jgi:hypothetical protein
VKNPHYILAFSVTMIKTSGAIFDISMQFWYDKKVFLKGIIKLVPKSSFQIPKGMKMGYMWNIKTY